jgi:MFS family permease
MGIRGLLGRLLSPLTRLLRREFSFISGNYLILIVSWMMMDVAMETPVPYYQLYVQALEGTGMALGIIGFANFIAMAVVAFPGGYLADKYGRRWLITTMTFGLAFSYLFYAFAPEGHLDVLGISVQGWHFILAGATIQGLCLIYQPALFAMVQDSLPPERRGVGSSLIQMIHGTFNTPGPVIGGLLLLTFGLVPGMRIVYMFVFALFISAAIWRLRLKETITNADPIRFRYFISSYPQAFRECCINVWETVPKSVLWLFAVQIMLMFANAQINVINSIYAIHNLGIPEELWWLAFVPLLVTMIVASIPIGKAIDRIGPKIPLLLGPIVLALSTTLFVFGSFFTVMVSMCLNGLVFLLIMSSAMALTASLVEPENRGKVRGFLNFMGYVFTAVGMLLGNFLYDLYPPLPFLITITLTGPMFVIVVLRIRGPAEQIATY